ncbi:MAG TPA: GatB/YqeY domain-containing protein [Thermoanaerobaculia bacterium]|nr:GatB/YqeY domain-containing protein [Thermoanaerobaculia bacterium]
MVAPASVGSPRADIERDIREALRARETERLQTLRLLLADIKNKSIELGRDVDRGEFAALVRKGIKQRHEAAQQYEQGGRPELKDKELREAEHLERYLPAQASEEDLRRAIRELVAERGLHGPAAIGPVMKEMMKRFGGATDGATVNRVAREVLSESS